MPKSDLNALNEHGEKSGEEKSIFSEATQSSLKNEEASEVSYDPEKNEAEESIKNKFNVHQILHDLKNVPLKIKVSVSIGFFLIIIFGIFVINSIHSHKINAQALAVHNASIHSKPNKNLTTVSTQDEDHAKLNVLQDDFSSFGAQTTHQFQQLQSQFIQLKTAQQKLIDALQNNTSPDTLKILQLQLATLQTQVDQLTEDIQKLKSRPLIQNNLPVSKLPFKVLSVDIWGGEPYVLVVTEGQNKLLKEGDTLAQWSVISVDYSTQVVLFENTKNQMVRVIA